VRARIRTVMLFASLPVFFAAGCSADESVGPPAHRPAAFGSALESGSIIGRSRVEPGWCEVSERLSRPDAQSEFGVARRVRVRFTKHSADSVALTYNIWQFDASGRQRIRATCQLWRGPAAERFVRSPLFDNVTSGLKAGTGESTAKRGVSGVGRAASIGAGTTCFWVGDNSLDIICGGVRCFSLMNLRDVRGHTGPTETKSPADLPHFTIAAWECADGGGVSMSSDGVATYHTPGGSGDGDGQGGGGCDTSPNDSIPVDGDYDQSRASITACDALLQPPPGFPAAEWPTLTWGEKKLVASQPHVWIPRWDEMKASRDFSFAQSMALTGTTTREDDTRQNAFQHAIWGADLARRFGIADAKAWTDAHEDHGKSLNVAETRQRDMDLRNNAVGIYNSFSSGPAPSGSAALDVANNAIGLCWLLGVGSSSSCGP
jgi:hypothetical protein